MWNGWASRKIRKVWDGATGDNYGYDIVGMIQDMTG